MAKKIKFNDHKKHTWCDKSDQNVSVEQIHEDMYLLREGNISDLKISSGKHTYIQIPENNDEQPRSRFNLTCRLKNQVIVNHDYIQDEVDGSYVATKSIEFNNHKQKTWLDGNNDARSTSCVNWKCALATVLALLGLGGGLATGIVNILKYTDAATGNSTIT